MDGVDVGAIVMLGIFVVGFALFVYWAAQKNKQHPGNRLHQGGAAMGNTKHTDPLDRTGSE